MKKAEQVELTPEDIEGLMQRLETETLSGEDLSTLKVIIRTYLLVIQTLQNKKATIKKLIGMLFGTRTEKAKTVLARIAYAGKSSTMKDSGEKARGHGRNGALAYTGAEKISVEHPTMQTGDMCPGCDRGKVYPLSIVPPIIG